MSARLRAALPAGMWMREWLVTLAGRRSLALRTGLPLLLAIPLVTAHAPSFWAGMLLTVLVAMVGAVGTGVTLSRARTDGTLARLAIVPRPAAALVGPWVLAATAVDCLQLAPVLALVALGGSGPPGSVLALIPMVPAALLMTNALGAALAAVTANPGDVLLGVVVVLAPLLFLGGLFTGTPAAGWRHALATADPFTYLHAAFAGALGGPAGAGPAAIATAALVTASLALLALVALSRPLLDRG